MKGLYPPTLYRIDFPPEERAFLSGLLTHNATDRLHLFASALLKAEPPIFSEFEVGMLIALVSPLRVRMPITWDCLMVAGEKALAARE